MNGLQPQATAQQANASEPQSSSNLKRSILPAPLNDSAASKQGKLVESRFPQAAFFFIADMLIFHAGFLIFSTCGMCCAQSRLQSIKS